MPREFPIGLTPPDWLVRNLQAHPAPVNRPAAARAAIALTLPLVIGLTTGHPAYGALASMGALSGVISDTADAYRMRILNIAVPQLFGAVGITLGVLVYGHGWQAVAAVTGVALLSGMISTIGAVASVSGLLLLLNCVVGAGLPMPHPWWLAPALLTGGGLLVLLLALLAWPLRSGVPERAAVAATYRTVAALLAVSGTDRTEEYEDARRNVTQSINQSYDLILARRARHHGRSPELTRLLAQLNAITPVVEAAPAAHWAARPLPPQIPEAIGLLARAVEAGSPGPAALSLPLPETETARAVDHALRHTAEVVASPDVDPRGIDDRLGRPATLGIRTARAARNVVLSANSWRYGLRLAVCIGIAQALVSLIPVPRSYWVALTITFVLKPDFGSVFSRALLRALGTVAGLAIAAVVLAEVPLGWWDVPAMLLLAPLVPALTPRGYGYQTAAITPVILLLSDILNHQGTALLLPRLTDSLLGCAIALTAGYLLWPESWRTRVGDRLADAVADTAQYVEAAFTSGTAGTATDPAARARMRRRLYRDLSVIRTEFQRALTEPPPTGRRAAAWWPLVVAVERIVDATTAARVRVKHGAPTPSAAEVTQIALQLRELSEGVRNAETLIPVRTDLTGPPGSVLEPLRQEVAAARSIASPH
ncbi:FUSC family protein [Streptomyces sp. CoH27]|uniref:FUSC family protein n=1 Tax=Streptomyces sp. CoH27 TaxID=2875763 RepID=UPI001CD793AE|nr:FUSC family protein [Streptomyces sp. CoH27]